jgi:hypothetical protein
MSSGQPPVPHASDTANPKSAGGVMGLAPYPQIMNEGDMK